MLQLILLAIALAALVSALPQPIQGGNVLEQRQDFGPDGPATGPPIPTTTAEAITIGSFGPDGPLPTAVILARQTAFESAGAATAHPSPDPVTIIGSARPVPTEPTPSVLLATDPSLPPIILGKRQGGLPTANAPAPAGRGGGYQVMTR